ncbi:hypothetical protein FACS189444_6910 [Spirochaetia bacterium]|nr:hypothetical protein FACS189444_6910 [Spirochaetia bacterium]
MRSGRTQDHLFVLNHGDTKKDVTLESAWGGRCTVDPYGVVIVSKQRV